jgi:hypothetical protein
MKRVAWLTDLHLNLVTSGHIDRLCHAVRGGEADAVLLGGNIGEAPDIVEQLEGLDARLEVPVSFVLGNHDFYRGSIARVRAAVRALSARLPRLRWPPGSGVISLTPGTALVGRDGWADGRYGDYERSGVLLNDYVLIEELSGLGEPERLRRLQALGTRPQPTSAPPCPRRWPGPGG